MANYNGGSSSVLHKGGSLILPRPSNSASSSSSLVAYVPPLPLWSPPSSSSSSVTGRSAALKVHSQAEKRRRERINAHLSSLRRMIPDASKLDKASLLGIVIDHVKDLKRKAVDAARSFAIPNEADEVIVEEENRDTGMTSTEKEKSFYIKASVSCDDRPDLFAEFIHAFHDLRLQTVRANITSLGGRVHTDFILSAKELRGSDHERVCLASLMESIKGALGRIASLDMLTSDVSSGKKQRILCS